MLKLCLLLFGVCVSYAASSSGPAALARAGRPRAALCLRGGACEGALWARRWLLTRASCLRGRALRGARVLPLGDTAHCDNITEMTSIGVVAYYEHPQFAREAGRGQAGPDAALALLAAPAAIAPLDDADAGERVAAAVPDIASWLQWLPQQVSDDGTEAPPTLRVDVTPLRLLVAAIVLPLAVLFLLFVLALRMTWSQPDDVPYDTLERDDEKEGSMTKTPAPTVVGPEAGDFEDILPMSLPL